MNSFNLRLCKTRVLNSFLAMIAASSLVGHLGAQVSSVPRSDFWITDGTVQSLATDGDTLFVGGAFKNVGPQIPYGAVVGKTSGIAASDFDKLPGEINCSSPDGQGGWFLGIKYGVIHLRSDGTIDPGWNVPANGLITSLVLVEGKLIVGGVFTSLGGSPRNYIAALNPTTGQVLPWDPGVNGAVLSAVVSDGTLYVGGSFSQVGDFTRSSLAAINVATGEALSWNARASGAVKSLALTQSGLLVGGAFTSIGGEFRTNVAIIDSATGFATAWAPEAPNGPVYSVVAGGGKVFVTGLFSQVGSVSRSSLASYNLSDGKVTAWNPNPSPALGFSEFWYPGGRQLLAIDGTQLFVGGQFETISGELRGSVASFDVATGNLAPWNPRAVGGIPDNANLYGGRVQSVSLQGSQVFVGGQFVSINATSRAGLAVFDETTGKPAALDIPVVGTVFAMTRIGSTLYLGGTFVTVGSLPRTNLAAINLTSGMVTSWSPAINGGVQCMANDGTNVIVGGAFSLVNGVGRTNLAAITADGQISAWNAFPKGLFPDFPTSFYVPSLVVASNQLFVGGRGLVNLGGAPIHGIGSVDLATGAATGFAPNFISPYNKDPWVFGMAANSNRVVAVGFFAEPAVFSAFLPFVAAFDTATSQELWRVAEGPRNETLAGIAIMGNTVYSIGPESGRFLAAFDLETGAPKPGNALFGGVARTMISLGDSLAVGGSFGPTSSSVHANNLAVFPRAAAPTLSIEKAPSITVSVVGDSAVDYLLHQSTDLVGWNPVATNAGSFSFTPAASGSTNGVYFRALEKP